MVIASSAPLSHCDITLIRRFLTQTMNLTKADFQSLGSLDLYQQALRLLNSSLSILTKLLIKHLCIFPLTNAQLVE